MDRWK